MASLRTEYEMWMRGQVARTGIHKGELLTENTVLYTADALENGVKELPDISITPDNLFLCDSYIKFVELESAIKSSTYYAAVNHRRGKGYFNQGLLRYKEFLKYRELSLSSEYNSLSDKDDEEFDKESKTDSFYSEPTSFEYDSKPRNPELLPDSHSTVPRYKRNKDRARNALAHAMYLCEVNPAHLTFKRKNSEVNYTEPHHLIPMKMQPGYVYSLDTEENIISLCSHCHNKIHYGNGKEEIIALYTQRKTLLDAAGISISLEDLLKIYGYSE